MFLLHDSGDLIRYFPRCFQILTGVQVGGGVDRKDDIRAGFPGLLDRQVVQQPAVDQQPVLIRDRLQQQRHRDGRAHGLDEIALGEHHFIASDQVRGDDAQGHTQTSEIILMERRVQQHVGKSVGEFLPGRQRFWQYHVPTVQAQLQNGAMTFLLFCEKLKSTIGRIAPDFLPIHGQEQVPDFIR
ncbi:MAG: hypothetical protein BWY83_02158 [bacterium ADurb.Bin478]|nr:MAG: hypothetical protein BWY83_02158 [bacterium ADurb.Bin478]